MVLGLAMSGYLHCQTKGYIYHTNYNKALLFTKFNQVENIDSFCYYYDKALETGIFFKQHHINALSTVLLYDKQDKAKYYVNFGLQYGLSKSDVQLAIRFARNISKNSITRWNKFYPFDSKTKTSMIFPKTYISINPENNRINRWASKEIWKAVKIDQRNGRKTNSKGQYIQQLENDHKVYVIVKSVVDSLGRIPTVNDIGEAASDELSLFFIHMQAESLITFLPALVRSINEGTFMANEDIAYSIERSALYSGSIIIANEQNDFEILIDTTSQINNSPIYSYIGECYFKYRNDTIKNARFSILPMHPKIGLEKVNRMRALLCLDPWEEFIRNKGIVIVDHLGKVIN